MNILQEWLQKRIEEYITSTGDYSKQAAAETEKGGSVDEVRKNLWHAQGAAQNIEILQLVLERCETLPPVVTLEELAEELDKHHRKFDKALCCARDNAAVCNLAGAIINMNEAHNALAAAKAVRDIFDRKRAEELRDGRGLREENPPMGEQGERVVKLHMEKKNEG